MSEDSRAGPPRSATRAPIHPVNDPYLTEYQRVLVEFLPALVHRSNNALTTIAAVLDLGADAGEVEREMARGHLDELIRSLRRLGALVPREETPSRPVDLGPWLADLAALLGTIAETRRCGLDLRVPHEGLTVAMDAPLERRLVSVLLSTLLQLDRERPPQRARLTARCLDGRVVVILSLRGAGASSCVASLAAHPGVHARARRMRTVDSTRIVLPALGPEGARVVPARERAPTLLVLERSRSPELLEVLSQHGYRPISTPDVPSSGTFDLVLVDEDWARATGNWEARIATRPALARVPILCLGDCAGSTAHPALPRPVSPTALLTEVARLATT